MGEAVLGSSSNISKTALVLHNFLKDNNECAEFALNIWVARKHNSQLPVWIDIPITYSKGSDIKTIKIIDNSRKTQRNYCLNSLVNILHVKQLPYSSYKSVQSKSQWNW